MLNSPIFGGLRRDSGIFRQLGARGEGEFSFQLEHGGSAGWGGVVAGVLAADHARRIQPEPFAVELERPIKVAHRKSDHVDARPHLPSSLYRPAASAMAVCRSRAPDLAWTVAELRPLSVVVARLSWFSTSAVVDATSMQVDARRPRLHHPSQHSDSSLC
jgi:hypothetical protein